MKGPQGIAFLQALLTDAPADCVTWPMFRDPNGYGRLGWNGGHYWAHRLMCELMHGPAPGPTYEAAHSCGNGKAGCVNPRHLAWATRARNQKDRRSHGTKARGGYRAKENQKLNPERVRQMRALAGLKTQREIAAMFDITDATVRDVFRGKTWRHVA